MPQALLDMPHITFALHWNQHMKRSSKPPASREMQTQTTVPAKVPAIKSGNVQANKAQHLNYTDSVLSPSTAITTQGKKSAPPLSREIKA